MENFVNKVLFTERCDNETDRDSIAIAITINRPFYSSLRTCLAIE